MDNRCCVKCDSILDRGKFAGVDVDLCPQCGGIWFDAGEIQKIQAAPTEQVQELRRVLLGDPRSRPAPSDLTTACPACTGTLKEVVLGPVQIDFCSRCRGLWLDRGELDQAVQAAQGKGDITALLLVAAASTR